MLTLAACLLNRNSVPRILIKNGKRGSAVLESWRKSDKCRAEVEHSSNAATSFIQSFISQPASDITSDICDQPVATSEDDRPPGCHLPNPNLIASNLITRDLNSLRADITRLQSQVGFLERYSDLGLIKNELQQMKSMMADLSLRTPSPTCTNESSTVYTQTASVDQVSIQAIPTSTISPSLKIAAWNCRGLNNALPYTEILAEGHDVIVLSEHWLWPFETHKFLNIHPLMSGHAIADRRLTPDCHLSKGCGGIGILWRKSLKVTPVSGVDSDRICAISIESTSSSILVIGVYLPTTTSPIDEYRHCLHTIENLINKYRDIPVIIAGNFNAHVGARGGSGDPNNQGSLLLEMISNNDLYVSSLSCISTGPLYTFFRENTTTTTDYIIVDAIHSSMVSESITLELHPLNSSDHLPLSIHLSIPTMCSSCTPSPVRLNWKAACEDVPSQPMLLLWMKSSGPYRGKPTTHFQRLMKN